MSQQPPYALHPRPSRAPQHAAALDGNTLRRGRLHRAMKLLLIAVVWVTGLFVVTAAVTMVAVATAPMARNSSAAMVQQGPGGMGGRTPGATRPGRDPAVAGHSRAGHQRGGDSRAAHGQRRGGRGQPSHGQPGGLVQPARPDGGSGPAVSGSAPTRVLAVYVGQGSANTSRFTIGGPGTWKVAWSYDCAGLAPPGGFTLGQDGSASVAGARVAESGLAGHGMTWARRDSGTHYLAIRTRCRWRLIVTSFP
jgi:hypothetical protein